jgi:raffinose/stachyose/melibiose transport system substrate-binding protein
MKNKQWMLRAVGVISALALGLGGLAACGNSSSAESKNGRVYYLNKKAEEQSTWVKLGKAFEKETGIPVQIQTGGTDYDATLRSELSKKAAPTMFQADGPSFMSSFKKYAKDLSNSDIYKQLDKNYKNRVLTNDEGKPIAIPYATESYGIIYNKSLLKKYFDASWSTVKSAEDINNFKALKRFKRTRTKLASRERSAPQVSTPARLSAITSISPACRCTTNTPMTVST